MKKYLILFSLVMFPRLALACAGAEEFPPTILYLAMLFILSILFFIKFRKFSEIKWQRFQQFILFALIFILFLVTFRNLTSILSSVNILTHPTFTDILQGDNNTSLFFNSIINSIVITLIPIYYYRNRKWLNTVISLALILALLSLSLIIVINSFSGCSSSF